MFGKVFIIIITVLIIMVYLLLMHFLMLVMVSLFLVLVMVSLFLVLIVIVMNFFLVLIVIVMDFLLVVIVAMYFLVFFLLMLIIVMHFLLMFIIVVHFLLMFIVVMGFLFVLSIMMDFLLMVIVVMYFFVFFVVVRLRFRSQSSTSTTTVHLFITSMCIGALVSMIMVAFATVGSGLKCTVISGRNHTITAEQCEERVFAKEARTMVAVKVVIPRHERCERIVKGERGMWKTKHVPAEEIGNLIHVCVLESSYPTRPEVAIHAVRDLVASRDMRWAHRRRIEDHTQEWVADVCAHGI